MQTAEKIFPSDQEIRECSLSVSALCASYTKEERVLDSVSLKVFEGDSVALLGHNGSGKSTLIRCLMGLMEIESGDITLFGERLASISGRKRQELRRDVGVVFQKHNLMPRLSVLTNVIHGALSHTSSPRLWFQGLASSDIRNEAMGVLESVGLSRFAGRKASALSGGQAQRVALARALMQRPRLILADEPVASLDPQAGEEMMRLLFGLCREKGVTLVFSTHHLDHAMEYADSLIALKEGRVICEGPSKSTSPEMLRRIYD